MDWTVCSIAILSTVLQFLFHILQFWFTSISIHIYFNSLTATKNVHKKIKWCNWWHIKLKTIREKNKFYFFNIFVWHRLMLRPYGCNWTLLACMRYLNLRKLYHKLAHAVNKIFKFDRYSCQQSYFFIFYIFIIYKRTTFDWVLYLKRNMVQNKNK